MNPEAAVQRGAPRVQAQQAPPLPCIIRPRASQLGDDDVVFATWCECLASTPPWCFAREKAPAALPSAIHALVSRILEGAAQVLVASDPNDPEQVFGYVVVGAERVLHWVYVKHAFRRARVGSRLMAAAFDDFHAPVRFGLTTPAIRFHIDRWHLVHDGTAVGTKALLAAIKRKEGAR